MVNSSVHNTVKCLANMKPRCIPHTKNRLFILSLSLNFIIMPFSEYMGAQPPIHSMTKWHQINPIISAFDACTFSPKRSKNG